MAEIKPELLQNVARYYAAKLAENGCSPKGVDWNSAEGQRLRFEQLSKIIQRDEDFSIVDIGCGYGAFFDFLAERFARFTYSGCDIAAAMIEAARLRSAHSQSARFIVGMEPEEVADYAVASGILNVKLDSSIEEWQEYVVQVIEQLDRCSRLGFSFNCLSLYSDKSRRRDDLYYADALHLFDLCKRRYASDVALLHDYGLYEFTILVRKQL